MKLCLFIFSVALVMLRPTSAASLTPLADCAALTTRTGEVILPRLAFLSACLSKASASFALFRPMMGQEELDPIIVPVMFVGRGATEEGAMPSTVAS